MSYKLRAYRVAGGAACPEAIIFYLLYPLHYILKHETRNGRAATNELHEVSRTTKTEEASLSLLSKLSMLSLRLPMPPRAADMLYDAGALRDALALSTCHSLFPIAVAISFVIPVRLAWLASKTTFSVADNAFATTTLPTLITAITDITDILFVSQVNSPVSRLGY